MSSSVATVTSKRIHDETSVEDGEIVEEKKKSRVELYPPAQLSPQQPCSPLPDEYVYGQPCSPSWCPEPGSPPPQDDSTGPPLKSNADEIAQRTLDDNQAKLLPAVFDKYELIMENDYEGYFEHHVRSNLDAKLASGAKLRHNKFIVDSGPYRASEVSYFESKSCRTTMVIDFYSVTRYTGSTPFPYHFINEL